MLSSDQILERAAQLKASGVPFVLATVVRCESPTSARPGAKAIVDADGGITGWIGGGCAQPAVISTARKALQDGEPRLIRVSPTKGGEAEEGVIDFGMTCHSGGTLDIFLEPYTERPGLLIIGASPAAQSLASLAQRTGFAVHAACPGADETLFPDAVQVIDGLDLSRLACGRPTFVVVATQGKRDEEGLEAALDSGAGYIAFIASARKADKLRTYLKERGKDPGRVDTIQSPAGIEIGAVTPEEVALSVLAGLVKARREGVVAVSAPVRSHSAAKPVEPPAEILLASKGGTAIDPVCGMSVDIATAEYRSEHQGHGYYFCCGGCRHEFEKEPQRYVSGPGVPA